MSSPPGSLGLPLLGETLSFAKNAFAFVDDRVRRHGPVFQTHLLGKRTIFLSGAEAASAFIDPENVQRRGSLPPHVVELFREGAVNQLDGEAHRVRKAHVLSAVGPAALADYLPDMRALIRPSIAEWRAQGEVSLVERCKRLSMSVVAKNIHGIEQPAQIEQLVRTYEMMGTALVGIPLKLPGFPLPKALAAQETVLALYDGLVKAHRAAPSRDGLSKMLASEVDGQRLDDESAVKELHHIVVAGFIVWAFMAWGVRQLALHPELTETLVAEVEALPEAPSGRAYMESPALSAFVQEVRRTAPVVPFIFGKAKRSFQVSGFEVPAGSPVAYGLHAGSNLAEASVFTEPERFDPGRFGAERHEQERHEHAVTTQGNGPPETTHRCAGVDYAALLTSVFFAEWLRAGAFTVLEPRAPLNWTAVPPEPKDGLRVRF